VAALLGYISNNVSRAGVRFSADFGGNPGVKLRGVASTERDFDVVFAKPLIVVSAAEPKGAKPAALLRNWLPVVELWPGS